MFFHFLNFNLFKSIYLNNFSKQKTKKNLNRSYKKQLIYPESYNYFQNNLSVNLILQKEFYAIKYFKN